jgi:hypothetical protein
MKTTFSQSDTSPIIARIIMAAPLDESGFVSHDTIVSSLLDDPAARAIISAATAASKLKGGERGVAANMVAWFSQQITVGRSPWADVLYRKKARGSYAYRAIAEGRSGATPDVDIVAIEGEPRLLFHLRRERSQSIVIAKRDAVLAADGELKCEACDFVMDLTYHGLAADIFEVHHRLSLADAMTSVETRLEDLAILCANCHRAIHKLQPLIGVEAFKARYIRP